MYLGKYSIPSYFAGSLQLPDFSLCYRKYVFNSQWKADLKKTIGDCKKIK